MTVIIFVGPTLNAEATARLLPQAVLLGPAGSGDVYRAARQSPRAIGIIDGAFDQRLAVRHKEVLWALARGIPVYGAASMGALRAVELAPFGMQGVGTIFGWFRDGQLEDDDEVAVAHATGENRFSASSEALVNVRATCSRAVDEGVLPAEQAESIVSCAKRLFYADRTWPAILERAAARVGAEAAAAVTRFRRWLGDGFEAAVDLKAQDARSLLATMAADCARDVSPGPASPSFVLEETEAWVELKRYVDRMAQSTTRTTAVAPPEEGASLLAELERTAPHRLPAVMHEATRRALGLMLAGFQPSAAEAVQAASEAFRRARGLSSPEDTHAWMTRSGLDIAGFSRMMDEDARIASAAAQTHQAIVRQVPVVLRRNQQ